MTPAFPHQSSSMGVGVKLALVAGSLVVALLAVEAGLRLSGFDPLGAALDGRVRLVRPSQVPARGYELIPAARGDGWGTFVEVNSRGFRGPEPELAVEHARIVALGDSITFGNDLAYGQTWPALLQRELADSGAPEVFNLGLGGYDTTQEVATLEDLGLGLAPAHVIVGYCVNDVGIVSMSMESAFNEDDRENLLYVSRIAQWMQSRRMQRIQERSLYERNREDVYGRVFADEVAPLDGLMAGRVADLRAALESAPAAERDLATRRIPPRWYASERRIGRLQHAFDTLAELSSTHGFAVTVLLIPYLEEDPLIERGLDLVAAMAVGQGFAVVDPRASFRQVGSAALRIRSMDPVHPNARGHALLAQALAAHLGRAQQ